MYSFNTHSLPSTLLAPQVQWVGTKPLSFSLMKPCDLTFCSHSGNILLLIVTGLLSCVKE